LVVECRPGFYKPFSTAVKKLYFLLPYGLRGYEIHCRSRNCFTDRLRISAVVLVAFYVRFHILGRNNSDGMPQLFELSRPMVRTSARFNAYNTAGKLSEAFQQLVAPHFSTQQDLSALILTTELEHVLCEIYSKYA